MKIVINRCFGGFDVSDEAKQWLSEHGFSDIKYSSYSDYRANPLLIKCVETLGGGRVSGRYDNLKVIEIPDDVEWEIIDYDGVESIVDKYRIWRGEA